MDGLASYRCDCSVGWTGPHCETGQSDCGNPSALVLE